MTHRKKVLTGVLFGVIYWLIASVGVFYGHSHGNNGNATKYSREVRFANTISYEIKAERFVLRQDAVGLYGTSPSRQEIESFIRQIFGKDGEIWALCICDCESSYRPSVVSPAGYVGLFQYEERTFYANGGIDIFDWQEQVRLTKKLYDKGEVWRWPECNGRCVET